MLRSDRLVVPGIHGAVPGDAQIVRSVIWHAVCRVCYILYGMPYAVFSVRSIQCPREANKHTSVFKERVSASSYKRGCKGLVPCGLVSPE
jgi:hypothetical protein